MSRLILSRREILRGGGLVAAAVAMPRWTRVAFASMPGDKRLIVIVLRGALDGLAALAPIGDPAYAGLRGALALTQDGAKPALKIDGTFAFHPDLAGFKQLFDAGELIGFHAVASAVRERSHFEAQAILETGLGRRGGQDGWLNRALGALGQADAARAVAYSEKLPLLMRGTAPTATYLPSNLSRGSDDFLGRISAMYASDPMLSAALKKGMEIEALAAVAVNPAEDAKIAAKVQKQNNLEPVAEVAGRMMARPDGPRVAVLEAGGWDTHINQGAADGPLARRLANLNSAVLALKAALGDAWASTAVVIATEFGRTARPNGNGGTDHGTGTTAFLLGGAVRGGRIVSDWPGLGHAALFEGRDLAATMDIRSVFKGALAGHLEMTTAALDGTVFPDSGTVRPIDGLIRG